MLDATVLPPAIPSTALESAVAMCVVEDLFVVETATRLPDDNLTGAPSTNVAEVFAGALKPESL